jgi:hypothetical protein
MMSSSGLKGNSESRSTTYTRILYGRRYVARLRNIPIRARLHGCTMPRDWCPLIEIGTGLIDPVWPLAAGGIGRGRRDACRPPEPPCAAGPHNLTAPISRARQVSGLPVASCSCPAGLPGQQISILDSRINNRYSATNKGIISQTQHPETRDNDELGTTCGNLSTPCCTSYPVLSLPREQQHLIRG